jgi:hypothetical protein
VRGRRYAPSGVVRAISRRRRSLAADLWDCYVGTTRQRNQEDTRNRLSANGKKGMWRRWKR